MVLNIYDDIQRIIKERPNSTIVEKGVMYNRTMRKHLYGTWQSVDAGPIKELESDSMNQLRKTYLKSNKDLFARLGRPIDKVFSAKGGGVYFGLDDAKDSQARILANNIGGCSVRDWVQIHWKPHMLDDPFGIVFMEILAQPNLQKAKSSGQSYVYPTYKPITCIHDYLPVGKCLEYVVFELHESEKVKYQTDPKSRVFRVVDDAYDYIVEWKGEEIIVLQDHTLPNHFGKVPGIINSDITNPDQDSCYLSFFDEVIELAEHYWRTGSIKLTHDFLHGFPKYVEFADDCSVCEGTGYYQGDICTVCKGTKKKLMSKVSDAKALSWPQKEDVVILPTQVAGYISPDKTYHEIATQDLKSLENVMFMTLWGVESRFRQETYAGHPKTATQIIDEMGPVADRLSEISSMAEIRHKFIVDTIIKIQIVRDYQGCSVKYGRRYLLESPEALWNKYSNARSNGAPQSVLDDLLNEYYETLYQNDLIGLETAKKLMYVEPFVHYSVEQVKELGAESRDYYQKLYYSEWLALVSPGKLLSLSTIELKSDLGEYVQAKQLT